MLNELKDLSLLIQLQNIDHKLKELEDEQGDLPEILTVLNEEIVTKTEAIRNLEAELKELDVQKQLKLRVLEEARQRLKRSQSILITVKTTREYDAVSSEIDQAKATIQETEKRVLELSEFENRLKETLKQTHSELQEKLEEHKARKIELEERLGESDEERLQLLHEREKIVKMLKKPIYAHYERIRALRGGTAVAYITQGSCSYCYARIPAQRQVEIRKMDDLYLCEVCGCYLVSQMGEERIIKS